MKTAILSKGKEKQPLNRHSYIFSGAVDKLDGGISPGEIIKVYAHDGKFIAYGHYNPTSGIVIRLLEWDENVRINREWYRNKISDALNLRENMTGDDTNAVRLIFSEGDFLPGLIVDRFAGTLVLQSHTSGMDRDKGIITEVLRELLPEIDCIYEKSDGDGRRMEGLKDSAGTLYGSLPVKIQILENGIKYLVDITSQKTGFYTDQRANRMLLRKYVKPNDSVLDLFCFTDGFGLTAAASGAEVSLCDTSAGALRVAEQNFELNGFKTPKIAEKDCFEHIRELFRAGNRFDLVILDPPKLMPRKKDEIRALRAYKDLNFNTMKLLKPGGYLFTFSCSGNFSMEMFKEMAAYSVKDAKRQVQIIGQMHQSPDHPVSISVPETEYLKGLILRIL